MLMTTICSLDDQGVAEIMREVCGKIGCDEAMTLVAVDVALERFHKTGSRAQAVNAGSAWVARVKRSNHSEQRNGARPAPGPVPVARTAGRFTRPLLVASTLIVIAASFAIGCALIWSAL